MPDSPNDERNSSSCSQSFAGTQKSDTMMESNNGNGKNEKAKREANAWETMMQNSANNDVVIMVQIGVVLRDYFVFYQVLSRLLR